MAKKSGSSKRWLAEHAQDEYVLLAKKAGLRSRASYKLLQIQEKYPLLSSGQVVIDLGAAPGGWSQVAADIVSSKGQVIAVDILEMDPIPGVQILCGDFTEDAVLAELEETLGGKPVDLVISDMAPNLSGMKDIDQPRVVYLVELALDLAKRVLKPGGSLLAKCFEGSGMDALRSEFREYFQQVNNIKPAASRNRSKEIYLLGRKLKS
jgi:23S rRNA (uridine2552-2'-O)-methyltransferase